MEAFTQYLVGLSLCPTSIREHIKNIGYYSSWTKSENRAITQITYRELLGYVQYMKNQGISVATQNLRLNSIRKYYEYEKKIGSITNNPAKSLFIKGQEKRVVIDPLSQQEIEKLYSDYIQYAKTKGEGRHKLVYQRNSIIVGLLLWQGVQSGELKKLAIQHIRLEEGTIYIPSTRRSADRVLQLLPTQILQLHQYIMSQKGTQLFSGNMHNTIQQIVQEFKTINPKIKNAQHIRASVLLHWLKIHSKRQAQYMIGHKYISSTEKYEVQELTELTDLLSKHHLFSSYENLTITK